MKRELHFQSFLKLKTPEYVTVSINEEFIPGDQKETYQLKDGDNVEFLYFMGGGQRQL